MDRFSLEALTSAVSTWWNAKRLAKFNKDLCRTIGCDWNTQFYTGMGSGRRQCYRCKAIEINIGSDWFKWPKGDPDYE